MRLDLGLDWIAMGPYALRYLLASSRRVTTGSEVRKLVQRAAATPLRTHHPIRGRAPSRLEAWWPARTRALRSGSWHVCLMDGQLTLSSMARHQVCAEGGDMEYEK